MMMMKLVMGSMLFGQAAAQDQVKPPVLDETHIEAATLQDLQPVVIVTNEQAQEAWREQIAMIDNVDALLLGLERSGGQLQTLQAQIRYTKFFPFEGDQQTRSGTLYYVVEGEGEDSRRKFAVHFTELEFDDRIEKGEDRSYVFDGQWLVEKLHKEKQLFKRQVVPPGQQFDPLRLGEGPFPIPIGQSRDEILERFDATLLATDEGLEEFLEDQAVIDWLKSEHHPTFQLLLTPREEFAAELDLAEIRIWYRKADLLPRAAWTRAVNGNESTIQLINQVDNSEVPSEMLDTRVPPNGWDVEITGWRGDAGGTP